MKRFARRFAYRGLLFAWGGPAILAIVWAALGAAGKVQNLSVHEVVLGILSMTAMAFIAAGISVVYEIETLPKAFAALIQMGVLYADYLFFFLLNGFIIPSAVGIFTLIFVVIFALIWLLIYLSIGRKVKKMNRLLEQERE